MTARPRRSGTVVEAVLLCLMAAGGVALLWFTIDGIVSWEPDCRPSPEWRCVWMPGDEDATVADQREQTLPGVIFMLCAGAFLTLTPAVLAIRGLLRRQGARFEAKLRGEEPPHD